MDYKGWYWSPESKLESSLSLYYTLRIFPLAGALPMAIWFCWYMRQWLRWGLRVEDVVFAVSFLGTTALLLSTVVFAYTHLAHVRITAEGLLIRRGRHKRLQPWDTVGDMRFLTYIQPGAWKLTFTDGSPAVHFMTGGPFVNRGAEKPWTLLVEEINRRSVAAREAGG